MTDLVSLKSLGKEENSNVNNILNFIDPNTKIVLLGCTLNEDKMIFVFRSTKDEKYIVLIICKFFTSYDISDDKFKINSSDKNLFLVNSLFENTDDIMYKQNTGFVYEHLVRNRLDNFIINFLDNCELNFYNNNIANLSIVDFIKYLSSNRFIENTKKCIITGIISNFCDYNCEIYGYNKTDNITSIFGKNNNKNFKVILSREFMLLDSVKLLENNEGTFYFHISNINTSMKSMNYMVIGYFLKIDVIINTDVSDFYKLQKELYINILDFDKTDILRKDEELAWPIIKGMILAEL